VTSTPSMNSARAGTSTCGPRPGRGCLPTHGAPPLATSRPGWQAESSHHCSAFALAPFVANG